MRYLVKCSYADDQPTPMATDAGTSALGERGSTPVQHGDALGEQRVVLRRTPEGRQHQWRLETLHTNGLRVPELPQSVRAVDAAEPRVAPTTERQGRNRRE